MKIDKIEIIVVLIILVVSILVGTSFFLVHKNNCEFELNESRVRENILKMQLTEMKNFNKYYYEGKIAYNAAVTEGRLADIRYSLFSLDYDYSYYDIAIEDCVSARDIYVLSNFYYQQAIGNFIESKKWTKDEQKELIDEYVKVSDMAIDINWAMYEACEYFESACAFYLLGDYDRGGLALDKANEKIRLHDSMVKTYNSYATRIKMLEEE